MIKKIALFTSAALAGTGMVGCETGNAPMTVKEPKPTVSQDSLKSLLRWMTPIAMKDLRLELSASLPARYDKNACAIVKLRKGLSLVELDPIYESKHIQEGQSKRTEFKVYGFPMTVYDKEHGGTIIDYAGSDVVYSSGPKGKTVKYKTAGFMLLHMDGKPARNEVQSVLETNVIAGDRALPDPLLLIESNTGSAVAQTFVRSETPDNRNEAQALCREVAVSGSNVNFGNSAETVTS